MSVPPLLRRSVVAAAAGTLLLCLPAPAGAQDGPDLALPGGLEQEAVKAPRSARLGNGPVTVAVRLTGPSLAQAVGRNAKSGGGALDAAGQKAHLARVKQDQNAVVRAIEDLGGKELGRVSKALNAVVARIDADQVGTLEAAPGVASVRVLPDYQLDLTETVPYIGARSGQFTPPDGANGSGVTVAVLDSGVDYTHSHLGGGGTRADYEAAYGTAPGDAKQTTRDGLFPTGKVVEGYDFVGESWPNAPESPDDDPIDYEGHGTHVADIIAGSGGVAPGASILAVKVCSAISSSCSGLALLQGMDYALDPDGNGVLSDAADVINMSLGSSYGQEEDDLSFAAQNAVDFGVTVVASAGNSGDRPYIVGSPSTTPGVISVAQTQVPGAVTYPLNVTGITPSKITNTALVDWAPVGAGFSAGVVRIGPACPGNPFFNGNSVAGKVALVDRGACAVSLKTDAATKAGAVGVLVANNVAGDPPTFSFGGGDQPLAPTVILTQADGNRIKAALGASGVNPAVSASISPADSLPLAGSMVASSSRGPSMSGDAIKPDIAAPGASVSAVAGSGDGTQAFGGTSGAAPMVSGSAALLLSTGPSDPLTVKARLMGTADTQITTNPNTQPGVLAPITRIGGGEVRVDKAARASTIAFDGTPGAAQAPSLSYGFHTVAGPTTLERRLTVRNLGTSTRTYTLTPAFRYDDDAASGAVTPTIVGGNTVTVKAGKQTTVKVRLSIDAGKLPDWPLGQASQQGTGQVLNGAEFDGYITVDGGGDAVHVPWHVLPRKSADLRTNRPVVDPDSDGASSVTLSNRGAVDGAWEAFALTGTSQRIPRGQLPGAGDNLAAIDLRSVGVRNVGDSLEFAVSTWDERSHPAYPAGTEVQVDTNRDGSADWYVYSDENVGFAATGQTLVYVRRAGSAFASAYYYLDADLNSTTRVLRVPRSVLGLAPDSRFDFTVIAYDNYFTGVTTDSVGPMTYTVDKPRYVFDGELGSGVVPPAESLTAAVTRVPGGAEASASQTGILLLYRLGAQGREQDTVRVEE